jgi:hypothetical protein
MLAWATVKDRAIQVNEHATGTPRIMVYHPEATVTCGAA